MELIIFIMSGNGLKYTEFYGILQSDSENPVEFVMKKVEITYKGVVDLDTPHQLSPRRRG